MINNKVKYPKYFKFFIYNILLIANIFSQNEAGSIFLLISPGARASAMGEAQVALSNDAYSSYWNPAGLAFQQGSEIAGMHSNWLPNITDDLTYDFLAYRRKIGELGVFGAHFIYMNLGSQTRMDKFKQEQGTFSSYAFSSAVSYGFILNNNSSVGLSVKYTYQHLIDDQVDSDNSYGEASSLGFDFGYLRKQFLLQNLNFGLTLTNMGKSITFIDKDRPDPQPTNLTIGLNYELLSNNIGQINFLYDIKKLMIASYGATDRNGDGIIDGKSEVPHFDPFFKGLITSWTDDWKLKGDQDKSYGSFSRDGIIGGYKWNENLDDGDGQPGPNEMEKTSGAVFGDENWGEYNEWGQKEVGSKNEGKFSNELQELIHNFGIEYWPTDLFAVRAGYVYDQIGEINNLTYGFGIRFAGYGFDFSYLNGEAGHPLTNTLRFSLNKTFK